MAKKKKILPMKHRKSERKTAKLKNGDFLLMMLVFALVVFGVVMVFSASYYYSINQNGTPYYYLRNDILFALMGTAGFLFLSVLDYHKLRKYDLMILLGTIAMLLCLLFPNLPFVVSYNGSARWLSLKVFNLMPGEIAKATAILWIASRLSQNSGMIRNFKQGIVPCFVIMIVLCGLIAINNLITAATVAAIILGIMFVAGLRWRYFIGIGGLGVFGVIGLILSDSKGYRLQRVVSFLDPFEDSQGSGYQVVQGLLALGSGGLFGVGIGKSMQKTLYLPEPQNDFIYAIIGEELGFVGLLCLLVVYLLLIWRCVKVTLDASDLFGTLMAAGITIMLAVQVILNVMVVTSLMPPTGVALPFISWGGNSLIIFMGCMGIMMSISRRSVK